jgi:nucleoside-diphosphate-sugar epimerase
VSRETLIVGCGYLGGYLAQRLCRRGDVVHGTTRSESVAAKLHLMGVRPIILNLAQPSIPKLPDVERVLYCVSHGRQVEASSRGLVIEGLERLLDALSERVRRVVYTGSTGVFGFSDHRWVDESSPADPISTSSQIGIEAESLLRARFPGAVLLRLAGLYGPSRIIRMAAVRSGEPIDADPNGYLNFVHIQDAVTSCIRALDHESPKRLYLVADDEPSTRRAYYETLASLTRSPAPRFTRSDWSERSSKRVGNRLMREHLGVVLMHPNFREGLRASLVDDPLFPASG